MMFQVFITLGAIMFCVTPILFILALIVTVRRKPTKGIWWLALAVSFILFLVFEFIAIANDPNPSMPGKAAAVTPTISATAPNISVDVTASPSPATPTSSLEPTQVEAFATDSNISPELTENMESVLHELGYSLSQAYNLERIDDWAQGERYKIWLDMEYICFFYCQGDAVLSLRQSNGDFLWQAE